MNVTLRIYCGNRLFEWIMTAAMIGIACWIVIWPATISASAFRFILEIVTTQFLGFFFMVAGALRIAALVANGSWPVYGPYLRSFTAGAAALVWVQMAAALFSLPTFAAAPSPGIPVYFALTIGELISCYRALSDGRAGSN